MKTDVEIGGTDQKFNLLMARNLQREYGQEPQAVVTMPLLEGTDGVQKMSKSLGNYVGIDEPPAEMFGKLMSITDDLMWRYYELLTDLRAAEIDAMRARAAGGDANPRDFKVELAKRVIADFHSAAAARDAEEEFNRLFRRHETPIEMEKILLPAGEWRVTHLMFVTRLANSISEAHRLIKQGGVRIDGEKRHLEKGSVYLTGEMLIQVGKRRFLKVRGVDERIIMNSVRSPELIAVGYGEASKTLQVEFKNGAVYQYFGVPVNEYEELLNSQSPDDYLESYIKNGRYASLRKAEPPSWDNL
jgi:tyrosyl-tRNA synthetase